MPGPGTHSQSAPAITSPPASNTSAGASDLLDSLDRLTHAAQQQLGTVAQSAFFIGDGLQRAVVDRFFELWSPRTWTPANILQAMSTVVSQTVQASRLLATSRARSRTLQEIANKLEVFVLVKNLVSILNLPPGEFFPLPDLVQKAYQTSAYSALWAVEGVGHYYTDSYWERNGPPHGLLLETSGNVPEKSLLMLHAGMGLAFADRLLGTLTAESSAIDVRDVVNRFIELCDSNSRDGFRGAAIESLGLVARDFYPELMKTVDEQLQASAPELTGYFWHGVGRALYFSRKYFLPIPSPAWDAVEIETAHERDRLNAIAGLSWAVTLVNMRQPGIMEGVLQSYAERPSVAAAFMNGVSSSITMRSDTTPEEPFVAAFYSHEPGPEDRHVAALWRRCITEPALTALQRDYPALKQRNRLDQIFRFHDEPFSGAPGATA